MTERRNGSGIPIATTYEAPAPDGAALSGEAPGAYPFTRGVRADMYRGRLWTMRQYAGMGDAEETNRRFKFLVAQGTAGLSVAFDLPTQIGYDSDAAMAEGEVGRVGVAIDSVEDMERMFAGIALDQVSTSMTVNATATTLLAMYAVVAQRRGLALRELRGTVQNDILKEYAARGTYIYPVRPALRLVTDLIGWAAAEMPEWNTISISGYHMREAGCTAVQEVAFTLADGMTYVRAAMDAGLGVDEFGPRLSFFFNAHNDLFEEVAKFRAARRMWAKIMREEFGACDPRSWRMRFHAQTAGSTLTALQPENNTVRTTVQALAAVMGGTQSLHTNGFDEALALPSEAAVRLALRTQQVIAHESGVTATADPLGGSYYVEALTDEIEARAGAILKTIAGFDRTGGGTGMLRAIEQGYVQREIQAAAFLFQRGVEKGEMVVVGVNRFAEGSGGEEAPGIAREDDVEQRQVERVRAVRARRSAGRWAEALRKVQDAARSGTNLMPPVCEAVEAEATVGEIADTLRRVFGEFRETVSF